MGKDFPMKLEIARFYENKTRLFLLPSLFDYGKEFQIRFNRQYKFAVGIHDTSLNLHNKTEQALIYILFDKELSKRYFSEFIDWLKSQPYYVMDYVSSPDLNSRKHMVVLKIPERHQSDYEHFMSGRYSQMYSEKDRNDYFKKYNKDKALKVLDKTHDALLDYINMVNSTFDHKLTPEDAKDHNEYHFPLSPQEEIFNYTGSVQDRTFNKKVNKSWMEIKVKTPLLV